MPHVPSRPPVPVVILPRHEASWPEYHKGARYRVSILGISVIALLSVIALVVGAITHSVLVTGLIWAGVAVIVLWLVPKVLRKSID